ncbi:MAG: hypothetical protein RL277_1748 [Planctomycetota bacterium]
MSDELRSKLGRLLKPREAAAAPPPTPRPAVSPPLREQLQRRDARVARQAPSTVAIADSAARSVGPPSGLVACERSGTRARITRLSGGSAHGEWPLASALQSEPAALAQAARLDALRELPLEEALYLDTETTGLSGGAGTYVFLVGLARFEGDSFEIWQGFLDSPADEAALLAETARRIRAASCVVSFFGKSFDRHRLEDKMRLFGIEPPFADKPHLDLYWPLRRLHKGRFADCRLRTLERELAGVTREDDLPGSFAPAAWFDYLGQRAHRLEGVFQHNLDDVKSLAVLLHALSRAQQSAG